MSAYRQYPMMLVMIAVLNPLPVMGAPPVEHRSKSVIDIRIDPRGRLQGTVVNPQGQRQSQTVVALLREGSESSVARRVATDANGQFAFTTVTPGTYRLQTDEGVVRCRLWSSAAAPPSAAARVLLVNDASLVRGQRPIRELFFSDPLLISVVVAAAIAIPVAVHKSRDDAPEGS